MPDTNYIVMERASDGFDATHTTWNVITDITAASAEAAIRKAAQRDGTYLAIPRRSFKPLTVTTETKTIINIT